MVNSVQTLKRVPFKSVFMRIVHACIYVSSDSGSVSSGVVLPASLPSIVVTTEISLSNATRSLTVKN